MMRRHLSEVMKKKKELKAQYTKVEQRVPFLIEV
jgi:hypothetical protein